MKGAAEQHERAEAPREQQPVGGAARRREPGQPEQQERGEQHLDLGVEEPVLDEQRLGRHDEHAHHPRGERRPNAEPHEGRVDHDCRRQAGRVPHERERRVHEPAGQLQDERGQRVEQGRLAVEVVDADEGVVAQEVDVEQLVGVVQEVIVEADPCRVGRRT